jgi:hypothetical protein
LEKVRVICRIRRIGRGTDRIAGRGWVTQADIKNRGAGPEEPENLNLGNGRDYQKRIRYPEMAVARHVTQFSKILIFPPKVNPDASGKKTPTTAGV